MRRTDGLTAVVLGLLFQCAVSSAQAQEEKTIAGSSTRWQMGSFGNIRDQLDRHGPLVLATIPSIQEELALSPEQMDGLSRSSAIHKKQRLEALIRFLNSSPPDQLPGPRTARMAGLTDIRRAEYARAREVLEPEQYRRLLQLSLQVRGPMAIAWPEIQEELNLSPAQRVAVAAAQEWESRARKLMDDQVHEMFQNFSKTNDPNEYDSYAEYAAKRTSWIQQQSKEFDRLHERAEQERLKAERAIGKQLTRRQKERFLNMQGEPFEGLTQLQEPGGWRPDAPEKASTTPAGSRSGSSTRSDDDASQRET